MNEMIRMVDYPEWNEAWLDLAARYKQKAWELRKIVSVYPVCWDMQPIIPVMQKWRKRLDRFVFPLGTYSGSTFPYRNSSSAGSSRPLDECTSISTNDAALWSLDAIYMQEVIPVDDMR